MKKIGLVFLMLLEIIVFSTITFGIFYLFTWLGQKYATTPEAINKVMIQFNTQLQVTLSSAVGLLFTFIRKPIENIGKLINETEMQSPSPAINQKFTRHDPIMDGADDAANMPMSSIPNVYKTALIHEQQYRVAVFGALMMAVASCSATFLFPTNQPGNAHLFGILFAYGACAIAMGILLNVQQNQNIIEIFRLGFITPLFINTVSFLITIGYSHERWFAKEIEKFGFNIKLAILIAIIRLVVIPIFCSILCYLGWLIAEFCYLKHKTVVE